MTIDARDRRHGAEQRRATPEVRETVMNHGTGEREPPSMAHGVSPGYLPEGAAMI